MKTKTKEICNHGLDESGNPEIVGGGGGGGGGSYVFKVSSTLYKLQNCLP